MLLSFENVPNVEDLNNLPKVVQINMKVTLF